MALTQYGLHFGLCPKQSNKIEGVVLLQGVYFTNINHKGLQRTANEYDSRLMTHRIQIKSRLIFNSISSSAPEGTRESTVHASNQPSGGEYRGRRPETEPNKSLTPSGQVFYFPHGFLGHSPSGVKYVLTKSRGCSYISG